MGKKTRKRQATKKPEAVEMPAAKKPEKRCIAICVPKEGEAPIVGIGREVGEVLEKLEGRANTVMTRLGDEDMKQIDALVEVELFRSRSEAVAYFTHQGMEARKDLFEKVLPTVDRIRELKEKVKQTLK